ncbi:tRNA (5-methylaminomethyl-2-thiouridine)(34)-methyltransferase MnmD [Lacinutrix sp. 5H-3-7-4]|uniref:tRNA (5-methylaminomethyl-2-thiouridine)(34)-methyltransferase MnmD n=1 Tax=Lacinutrix sp. (strain 5H-3-7-4) TaxID=983544 RepID=UPI00020A3A08|nr:tRNA (5-methylaminomethyl-2-thiouridine)(34)-methyltransferase MnmD [Lacinutrix sp. 5H-3-7-4]AEH00112.1 protein of unknown function DUF752 [Lacinutrix sp. 5H-3-7-4]
MKREIITTKDGSKTIHIPEWNEQYHSTHGAIQEAKHVYIKHGLAFFMELKSINKKEVSILEIGFGTGLNAFLTAIEAQKSNLKINYTGVEGFPVLKKELKQLNYANNTEEQLLFNAIHDAKWESYYEVSKNFIIKKQNKNFNVIDDVALYDVIYFDAFGPRVQPELWTQPIFNAMYNAVSKTGVLVTYCAQGHARRAMITAGFKVAKVEGPPGKRHMLRAIK